MRRSKTEREKIRESTEESSVRIIEEITRADRILSAIGDGVAVMDRTFKVLYQNQGATDMMGAHLGQQCYMVYAHKESICDGCPVAQTFKDGKIHRVQRKQQSDKGTRYFEITASPLKDSAGEIVAGIEIVKDVTERKRSEEALRDNELQLQSLSDNLPNGLVYQIDSGEDGQQRRFTYISAGIKKMHGITADEALNDAMIIYDQVIAEDRIRLAEEEASAAANMVPFSTEVRLRMPSGELQWRFFTSSPRRLSNNHLIWDGIEIDITERKEVEQALKESEESFRIIFNNAADGIVLTDINNKKFHSCNKIFSDMLGYSEEEIKDLGVADIHPDEDLPYIIEQFTKLVNKETNANSDIPVKRKDGSIFYADIHAIPIALSGKNYLIGIFRDITERRVADEALRLSEDKFRSMAEITTDLLWEHDGQGRFTYLSPVFKDMFGYEMDEFMNKTPLDFMPGFERKRLENEFKEQLSANMPFHQVEIIQQHKDGHEVVCEVSGKPIFGKEGEFLGFRGVTRDITERRRVEEAEQKAREQARLFKLASAERQRLFEILDTLPVMVLLMTPEHDIVFSNCAFRKKFGESGGRPCYEHFLGFDKPCPFCESFIPLKTGQPHHWELTFPDGRMIIDNYNFPFFDLDGSPLILEMAIDITGLKRTEEELRERKRELEMHTKNLEEMNAALNVLLKKRDKDKSEIEDKVLLNMRQVVEPYVGKLKRSGLDKRQKTLVDIVESNLKDIISSFTYSLSSKYLDMTPKEITIVNLIRQGMTSKEICEILGASDKVVAFHRHNIRKKLGLLNKKVNLTTYLQQKFL
jgi:PAS domain S-box-containing protein